MISLKAILAFVNGEAALRLVGAVAVVLIVFGIYDTHEEKLPPTTTPTIVVIPTVTPTQPIKFFCYEATEAANNNNENVKDGYICIIQDA